MMKKVRETRVKRTSTKPELLQTVFLASFSRNLYTCFHLKEGFGWVFSRMVHALHMLVSGRRAPGQLIEMILYHILVKADGSFSNDFNRGGILLFLQHPLLVTHQGQKEPEESSKVRKMLINSCSKCCMLKQHAKKHLLIIFSAVEEFNIK